MSKILSLVLTCLLVGLAVYSAAAQDQATPAPSKTATAAAATLPAAATLEQGTSGEFEPLTQADLSILTGNVQRPNGIAWFNDKLYTACTGDSTVYEIDSRTGVTRAYIFGVRNAQTMYVEEDENQVLTIWVPDYANNTLARVSRNAVEPVVTDLEGPWGISYVDEDHFLVSNLLSHTVNLLSRDGDNEVVLDNLSGPMGLVHDGETMYVANYGSTRRSIEAYSLDNVLSGAELGEDSPVLVSGLQNTTGIQLASDGNLYFAYSLGNRGLVGRVDPAECMANGGCTNDQVEIVLYTDLAVPLAGLTVTPDMRLFVHTMFTPEIYWAQITG
jgi:sugar lactone lactonase YvrE